MSEVKISAEPRTEFGKGGARRTRRAGLVPAVIYGHGEAPRHIAVPAREFAAAIRHGGINTVFELVGPDGTKTLALPKAIQRDPLKDTFEHIDMIIVKRGEQVTVDVPVHLVGEAAKGTLVMHEHDKISLIAEALHLPEFVEASIEGLEAGAHVTAGDIKLPKGSQLAVDADTMVAVVTAAPTAEQLEGETAEAPESAEAEAAEAAETVAAEA
ncbi:50S ribosomal protein L25/general stress protein Ctc [Catellatospora citrea]|uniref:Large ribosomal subunit protein bL25 n=1 Tax=Catellatospora citrea TaxID=53366 RepID=A0A8J3KCT7_9ACTN|nr:50S ribosomal protein L25/general stress protein Ctc [Catellatospora citrea]RKE09340.1 LSU ribosomal protein L25P [Catellatospora citrea]GIF97297.1 50S ribosomal protein L25 [Catellatospora citrea]